MANTESGVPKPEQARADLAAALNAIEEKLNVPKQIDRAAERAKRRVVEVSRTKPVALGVGVAGAAALVGLGVFSLVRSIVKH